MSYKTNIPTEINKLTSVKQPFVRIKPYGRVVGLTYENGVAIGSWATFQLCDVEGFDNGNIKEETQELDVVIDTTGPMMADLTNAMLSKYPPV